MNEIIKQQQEVARKMLYGLEDGDRTPTHNLDTLVATIIANIGKELEAGCEGMPDMYPLDIFPEPWEGWQEDVDELAKSQGQRIDRISAHYARWQHKVTKDDTLTLIRDILKS